MIPLYLLVARIRFGRVARAASGQDDLRDPAQLDAVDLEKLSPRSFHCESDEEGEGHGRGPVARGHLLLVVCQARGVP